MAKFDIMDFVVKVLMVSVFLHVLLFASGWVITLIGNWIAGFLGTAPTAITKDLLGMGDILASLVTGLVFVVVMMVDDIKDLVFGKK